ncbi:MAG: alpha/beta fold hydrolase [Chitinophaga sp.]|uniref:alpha/beta fold hydrolase n=1 Tax=Chitinophaga sp. TaxID=1869181 RepID=UPI001B23E55B|nr:alpha/beta hydrolase [Chitinophaga sp.]MBO9730729.1 alpha/beta fold hydrolase [Chitinophaga sp.]
MNNNSKHAVFLAFTLIFINMHVGFSQSHQQASNNQVMAQTITPNSSSDIQYFTTGDGVKIAYQLDGAADKPVLVLANSMATDLHMWDDQVPTFTKYFRVLRFDTRGSGASDAPEGDYSVDRMGMDVINLLDALHIDKVDFIGLSLGGWIGQWMGIHASSRLNKLVLTNTSSYLGPEKFFNEQIQYLRGGGSLERYGDMFIHNWFDEGFDPAVVAKFRKMVLSTPRLGLASTFAAVRDADSRRTISLITTPTLVIGGINDRATPGEHSKLIAQTIPHSKLVMLPVIHLSNIEAKETFEKTVLDFLLK